MTGVERGNFQMAEGEEEGSWGKEDKVQGGNDAVTHPATND